MNDRTTLKLDVLVSIVNLYIFALKPSFMHVKDLN